jgi:arginyl-tRNA synthetase
VMAESTRWIPLDPAELIRSHRETIRGVQVTVLTSPYDIPEAVRGSYDEPRGCFKIEFKYMAGDEPRVEELVTGHVRLVMGRFSRRLYQIEIDVDKLKAEAVDVRVYAKRQVKKAIDQLTRGSKADESAGNYALTQRVISQHQPKLFEPLAA